MDHEEVKDLLPLKALDRLEADEDRAVATHLAGGCPTCERELASFREALGALALTADREGASNERIWQLVEARLGTDQTLSPGIRPGMRGQDRARRAADRIHVVSLAAIAIDPAVKPALLFAHCSAEQGHRAMLATLGVRPLFQLEMRLGEGSAAALGIGLLESSLKLYREMATFDDLA